MNVAGSSHRAAISSAKPCFHFVAPRGWMNDPCAPGYDPRTGLFHLFYQWNPYAAKWDKISWGHATSRDLVRWDFTDFKPTFVPDQPYDCEGIFTGCYYPSGPNGETDELSVFYTSVNYLPVHWEIPNKRGAEGLALATSQDGGKTCKPCSRRKDNSNPVLSEEPPHASVTGFRDPFLSANSSLAHLRGDPSDTLYGIISGGLNPEGDGDASDGPRLFLYRVEPTNLRHWEYLHPFVGDVPRNVRPSGKWAGDLGVNWECANFVSVHSDDGAETREVIILGSEGGNERPHVLDFYKQYEKSPRRTVRYANWFFYTLERGASGEVRAKMGKAGIFDWGLLYALATFRHPDGRTIAWGWATEEDLPQDRLDQKGWNGCFGVPREVFMSTVDGVVGLVGEGDVAKTGHWDFQAGRVTTLGIRPLRELEQLKSKSTFSAEHAQDGHLFDAPHAVRLDVSIAFASAPVSDISLHIRCSPDRSTRTSIVYSPASQTLRVIRDQSNHHKDILKSDEIGSFALFKLANQTIEELRLLVFIDEDLIEVFANERFSLTTRTYSQPEDTGVAIEGLTEGSSARIEAWEMRDIGLISQTA